jgi:cellulose synthase/poly-beta-1,6-N-acetylglucosamine synthase-like glycosyltransferase
VGWEWLRELLRLADIAILIYFLLINTGTLTLVGLAGLELAGHLRRKPFRGADLAYRSPLTPPVSVLMPAYNEQAGIVVAVRAMLALRYPVKEIVVVDDGSADDTFEQLQREFDLVEVPVVVPDDLPMHGAVRSVHRPRSGTESLVVVCKENGGRSDALNVGINIARHGLICMVDADSVLDSEALLTVVKPFTDDPLRVVATGGVVRVVNGCRIVGGRVVEVRMPRRWLPRIQVMEYLRAFLMGRTGWSRLGSLVIISGAFGLFRRDQLVELGGLSRDTVGEDAELVVRLHRRLRRRGEDYRIVFVAEPVCWTEVPGSWAVLSRQRQRWHRGLTEILRTHRVMVGNPRYGRIGLLALPYYLVFELVAPVVEMAAVVLVPAGLVVGAINLDFAWRFLLVAYGYAMVVSLAALAMEEVAFHRYHRWRDLGWAVLAAVLENLGYRQVISVAQLRGGWAGLRRTTPVWGVMTREGLG